MKRSTFCCALACVFAVALTEPSTKPTPKPSTRPTAKAQEKWILAQGAPQELQSIIDSQDELLQNRDKELRAKLPQLRADLHHLMKTKDGKSSQSAQMLKDEIARTARELQDLTKRDRIYLPKVKTPALLKDGFVGQVESPLRWKVLQVQDKADAIVEVEYDYTEPQVIEVGEGKADVFYAPHTAERDAWLSQVDTAGWVDNEYVDSASDKFVVRGTKTYRTVVGGTRTVIELVPFGDECFQRVPVDAVDPKR